MCLYVCVRMISSFPGYPLYLIGLSVQGCMNDHVLFFLSLVNALDLTAEVSKFNKKTIDCDDGLDFDISDNNLFSNFDFDGGQEDIVEENLKAILEESGRKYSELMKNMNEEMKEKKYEEEKSIKEKREWEGLDLATLKKEQVEEKQRIDQLAEDCENTKKKVESKEKKMTEMEHLKVQCLLNTLILIIGQGLRSNQQKSWLRIRVCGLVY